MNEIKIDMYEVQLGSALLLQFKEGEEWVSVLADAGIKDTPQYPLHHVRDKIKNNGALKTRHEDKYLIDLMVGTHYDKDHLAGLVPIIEDDDFIIGEAWMPPVANDTEIHAFDQPFEDYHFLAHQFSEDDGEAKLRRYLKHKDAICRRTSYFITQSELEYREMRKRGIEENVEDTRGFDEENDSDIKPFLRYLAQAQMLTGDSGCCSIDTFDPESYAAIQKRKPYYYWRYHHDEKSLWEGGLNEDLQNRWRFDSELKGRDIRNMAYIQQSAAKDAINAKSLYKVVKALKDKGVPIRCRAIDNGKPRRFIWKSAERKFIPSMQGATHGPEFFLLGPSKGLIKKHWDKLPIGDYVMTFAFADIPLKGITPSNQLSYVMRFEHAEQGVLVTGDAGCNDFKPSGRGRKPYYKKLLNRLLPLHVVQVAHHGGANNHFYRVLLKAGYAKRDYSSYLLLSHETDDRHRPSNEFGLFVEQVRYDADNDISLLFTSRPQKNKVQDYATLIHPLVGVTSAQLELDVSLSYKGDFGWQVTQHGVHV